MNETVIIPRPLGILALIANAMMVPIMYVLSGTLRERPQSTHPWTCQTLTPRQIEGLCMHMMSHHQGFLRAMVPRNKWDFRFHAPIFGGWRKYVVIDGVFGGTWYIGWRIDGGGFAQISRIPLVGPVRALIGPENVSFFGILPNGEQMAVSRIAEGKTGDGGPFRHTTLL